jgi:hypothetical protein
VQSDLESISIPFESHCLESISHPLRIAMLATLTYFSAACYWVPSHLRPFYMGVCSHQLLSMLFKAETDEPLLIRYIGREASQRFFVKGKNLEIVLVVTDSVDGLKWG